MPKKQDSKQDSSSAGLAQIVFVHIPSYLKCALNDDNCRAVAEVNYSAEESEDPGWEAVPGGSMDQGATHRKRWKGTGETLRQRGWKGLLVRRHPGLPWMPRKLLMTELKQRSILNHLHLCHTTFSKIHIFDSEWNWGLGQERHLLNHMLGRKEERLHQGACTLSRGLAQSASGDR